MHIWTKFTIITASLGLAFTAGASTIPFTEDFEGFANQTDIDGSNGWDTVDVGTTDDNDGRAVAQNGVAAGGSLSGIVTNTDLINNFTDDRTNIFVQFLAQPYFGPAPDVPADASAAFYLNSTGTVIAYSSTVAIALNNELIASNAFATFVVSLDYNSSSYDLYVDGNQIADDFAFYSGANSDFNAFMVRADSGTNASYLDDVSFDESNPFFQITNAVANNPNIELYIGDASIGGVYKILSADNDGAEPYTLLTTATNLLNPFLILDPTALNSSMITSRYYKAVNTSGSSETTNSEIWVFQKQPRGSNTWHAIAAASSYSGGTNENGLHKTLGDQLANALTGTAAFAASDQLWFWDYTKNDWTNAHLDGTGEWRTQGGYIASNNLPPTAGMFVKTRAGLLRPATTNSIFTGIATTNATPLSMKTDKWILFAWPFIAAEYSHEGTGDNQGWGFANQGGTKALTSAGADRLFMTHKNIPYDMFLYTNGRFRIKGTAVEPNIPLQHGAANFYLTRGSDFNWTPTPIP